MKAGSDGVAQGRMNTTSSAFTQKRLRKKKPDSRKPSAIFTFTPTPT